MGTHSIYKFFLTLSLSAHYGQISVFFGRNFSLETERGDAVRASPNGVPLSAGDSSRPLSGLLAAATPLESLLVEMYVLRVEATLLCGRQETLTGVRLAGEVVAVPGLSTGTEDQLFLALRIAAVEDYLGSAVALPFVADDLFINFDPERAAAGFEVLGQLAERTQVLFYTHHPHLVDVARETLGTDIDVVSLDEVA